MSVVPSMSVSLLKVTLDCAEHLGLDRGEITELAGLLDTDLENAEERVPVTASVRLSAVLRAKLGPSAALQLGALLANERGSILSYLAENCPNLGDAYRIIERYRPIAFEVAQPRLVVGDSTASFSCAFPAPFVEVAPDTVELFIAFWLSKGRYLTRQDWTPKKILLQSPPSDTDAYARVFRCPVVNHAATSEIVFDASLVQQPVVNSDPNLLHFLELIADDILKKLPQHETFCRKVQSTIAAMLPHGKPALDQLAEKLNISARTIQRRLAEEETSFAALLDEARRVAALKYVSDSRISISEAARLVGYSEPSTFYRAFKRWTDTTPADYRRSVVA